MEFMSKMRNKVDYLYHHIEHVAEANCSDFELEDKDDDMEEDDLKSHAEIVQVVESFTNPKTKKKLKRRTFESLLLRETEGRRLCVFLGQRKGAEYLKETGNPSPHEQAQD